jgi:anti-anti-sigma factor
MVPPPNQASTPARSPLVVRVKGEVDLATSPRLAHVLTQIPEVFDSLVIDVSGVSFMDCSALPALLAAEARFGPGLSLCGVRFPVMLLLRAADLSETFTLCHVAALDLRGLSPTGDSPPAADRGFQVDVELADPEPCPGHSGDTDRRRHAGLPGKPYPRNRPDSAVAAPTPGNRVLRLCSADASTVLDHATGLLMGSHRCGAERARDRLQVAASAHGVSVIDLANGLIAAAAQFEGYRCAPAVLTALVAVMKPDPPVLRDARTPRSEVSAASVLRPLTGVGPGPMLRQRSRPCRRRPEAGPWPGPGSGEDSVR